MSVNANDFRLNNWVNTTNGYSQVEELSINNVIRIKKYNGVYRNFEPITLTSKILLDCGFKYGKVDGITSLDDFDEDNNSEDGVTHYWDIDVKQTDFVESHSISLVKWGEQEYFTFQLERGYYRQKIKYLHQLQNLYYCLTGKELEYSPETKTVSTNG